MRHGKKGRKLSLEANKRRALIRGLASNLILKEKIKTTEPRAKELRPYVERLITYAKKDTPSSRRLATAKLGTTRPISKLFADLGPKYEKRAGGYTRITKLPARKSDASPMAIIEFV